MKSVILAITIFILIIITIALSYCYTSTVTDELLSSLEKNEKFIAKTEYEMAKNETDRLYTIWSKSRKVFAFFVNHADLNEIDYKISELSSAVKSRESADFTEKIGVLKIMIGGLKGIQKASMENIF